MEGGGRVVGRGMGREVAKPSIQTLLAVATWCT